MMRSVLAPDSPCLCTSPCAPLPPAMKYSFVTHTDGLDNSLHTYNRYGVQLGEKVPLWGGFTGHGKFTLNL